MSLLLLCWLNRYLLWAFMFLCGEIITRGTHPLDFLGLEVAMVLFAGYSQTELPWSCDVVLYASISYSDRTFCQFESWFERDRGEESDLYAVGRRKRINNFSSPAWLQCHAWEESGNEGVDKKFPFVFPPRLAWFERAFSTFRSWISSWRALMLSNSVNFDCFHFWVMPIHKFSLFIIFKVKTLFRWINVPLSLVTMNPSGQLHPF